MTNHALGITKRNVHAKFQENRPKNVEARLKKPTKKKENNSMTSEKSGQSCQTGQT